PSLTPTHTPSLHDALPILVSQTFRLTNPFISNSCNSFDKIRGEIPASLDNSLNPFLPLRKTEINTSFHFPPTTSNVSLIAILAFEQLSTVCFLIYYPFCKYYSFCNR